VRAESANEVPTAARHNHQVVLHRPITADFRERHTQALGANACCLSQDDLKIIFPEGEASKIRERALLTAQPTNFTRIAHAGTSFGSSQYLYGQTEGPETGRPDQTLYMPAKCQTVRLTNAAFKTPQMTGNNGRELYARPTMIINAAPTNMAAMRRHVCRGALLRIHGTPGNGGRLTMAVWWVFDLVADLARFPSAILPGHAYGL